MTRELKLSDYSIECGVEVGFIDTFFSSSNPKLGNVISKKESTGNSSLYHFGKTTYSIQAKDYIGSSYRSLELSFKEDVHLMDIVQRYVLKKDDVKHIVIGNEKILHKRKNFYYQFPLQNVEIHFANDDIYNFSPTSTCDVSGLTTLVYVRDEPDLWIFHIRLLSLKPDIFSTKGCIRQYNRPFPYFIQILCSFFGLQKSTLYIRERISQRIPFQTNGASLIQSGSRIIIHCCWKKI